jgi:hypothetical protein
MEVSKCPKWYNIDIISESGKIKVEQKAFCSTLRIGKTIMESTLYHLFHFESAFLGGADEYSGEREG